MGGRFQELGSTILLRDKWAYRRNAGDSDTPSLLLAADRRGHRLTADDSCCWLLEVRHGEKRNLGALPSKG